MAATGVIRVPVVVSVRTMPQTPDERREQALSFGDQEAAVYQALVAWLGDDAADDAGYIDIWIADLSTDWVVWKSWCTHGPGPGLWRLGYEMDDSNAVTFSGDPEAVIEQTAYLPVEAKSAKSAARVREADPVAVEARAALRNGLRNVREVRRCTHDFDLREKADGTGGSELVFTGFASVTDAEYEMEDWLGPWVESVSVGAFAKTLREGADVAFLVNHEGLTLARTKSGTLKLSEVTAGSPTGLHSEARLDPKSPHVKALRSAVDRGDIDEMSFAFRVTRQEWNEDYDRRWINEVNINQGDVSAVNYGANPWTGGTVAMRAAAEARGLDWRRFVSAIGEIREGKTISAANNATLTQVLGLISSADDAVDEAQEVLAGLMGVPNPDADDAGAPGGAEQDGAQIVFDLLTLPDHVTDARRRLAALSA